LTEPALRRGPPAPALPPDPASDPAPEADTALPPTAQAVATSERPRARPAPGGDAAARPPAIAVAAARTADPARQAAAPAPGQRAQGSGDGAASGSGRAEAAAALPAGRRDSLMAGWGARIAAQIQRRTPPAGRAARVVVRLTIGRDGRLLAASVQRSSGDAAVDGAALRAVRAAGRFPGAPRGLTEARYSFTLPIRFQ
jgi:protein TonB